MERNDFLKDNLKRLEELSRKLELRFKNEALFLQALTHRSFVGDHPDWPYGDNERLEFLGDAVLDAIISHLLYNRFGREYREGELSKMRAWLVNEERLARIAQKLELDKLILLGTGEEKGRGRQKPSILAATFEALVAAVYLDHGYDKVFQIVKKLFSRVISQAEKGLLADHKTLLQEFTQALFKKTPKYILVKETGPEHAKKFFVEVKIGDETLASGKGSSKKAAEQAAAKKALKILEEKYGKFTGKK
ncbi:ribonuclease III [Thermodesulfatator indicus DSM 15286]|uniref:Ribonuclease 3 n=1 Tax=Thermodesulfatator indicus (strain DSM 15286 / JCM 11887 / CIR29812) TaxID=667014 RepID=F8ADI4_THEID|nr:ribonuclease III [Thermodesulfatator indicus]AEH44858.1 ribonuclease III [Thermodesulfatator indicus DSM 15286]